VHVAVCENRDRFRRCFVLLLFSFMAFNFLHFNAASSQSLTKKLVVGGIMIATEG